MTFTLSRDWIMYGLGFLAGAFFMLMTCNLWLYWLKRRRGKPPGG